MKTAVQSGIVEFSTAATPLSICFSLVAMSKNGREVAKTAITSAFGRIVHDPTIVGRLTATTASSGSAPRVRRTATRVTGAVSSTMILMKRKDAPQTQPNAARTMMARVVKGSVPCQLLSV